MQTRKRILVIENAVDVTGGLKSILNSSGVLSNNFEFIIALPKNTRCTSYTEDRGFQVVGLPYKELNKTILSWIVYLPSLVLNTIRLNWIVKKMNIELIIANDFYNLLPCSYRFFGGNVPYVCFVRFMPNRFPKVLVRIWEACHQKFSDKVIAVSNAVKNKMTIGNVEVIYEGLQDIFDTHSAPADRQISKGNTLLYLSNYINGKGHEFALQSFAKLATKYPSWKLRFVGGDMGMKKNKKYKEFLTRLAIEMKIQDQIEWIGFSNDVQEEYLMADIVLNFSNSESFSLTCLEAMAVGRAIISTNSGGPAEIIVQNESGILVPVADVSAMILAMDSLMRNEELRITFGKNAFYHVRQKFNFSNTIDKLKVVYFKSLAN